MLPIYRSSNRGAALIAVLLVVLLISVLGSIAMRQGMSGLKQVSAEQILRMQTDMNNTVWNGIQRDSTSLQGKAAGSLVYTVLDTEYEIVFCYKPTKAGRLKMFDVLDHQRIKLAAANGVKTVSDNGKAVTKGFCNIGDSDSWNSRRKISVTQVHARRLTQPETNFQLERAGNKDPGSPFAGIKTGYDQTDTTSAKPMIRFVITTMTLGVASASASDVNVCLQQRYADNLDYPTTAGKTPPEGLAECLNRIGVPAQTLVAEIQP